MLVFNAGCGISETALIFGELGDIPLLLNLCPRKVMLLAQKTHSELFSFSLDFLFWSLRYLLDHCLLA